MGEDADRTKQDTRPYWKVTASLFFSLLGTALFLVIGIRALGFFMPFVIGWFILTKTILGLNTYAMGGN